MKLQGIPLLFGALLALAVTAVMLSLTLVFRTEDFPSIHYACSINGLSPTECLSRAQGVGLQCLIAFTIVLALAIWRSWFFQNEIVEKQTPQTPLMLFLTFALGLFSLHVGILVFGPAFVSRLNETESYGDFISLENLLLPLLLQFFVATPKDSPARFPLLAALLMGMALSPYRAMLLALFCFGLLLPWLLEGWRVWCGKPGHESPKILGYQAVWVLLIGVALLVAGLQDTKMRSPTLLAHSLGLADLPPEHPLSPEVLNGITQRKMAQGVVVKGADQTSAVKPTGEMLPASAEEMLMPAVDLKSRLAQRLVFPLFQAAIAGQLSELGLPLPSLGDQFLRKLRLSQAPNLEEFLFRHIYGGEGHGETTSLSYGEARVYFPGPPLIWMVLAPLALLLVYRALAHRGLNGGSLFGLALWRSSFSGLLPILPALLLQSLGLWLMSRFHLERLSRLAGLFLAITLLMSMLVESWGLAMSLTGRRDVLYARFELADGCWLESPSWLPVLVDRIGAGRGLPMNSVVVAYNRTAVVLAQPYGRASELLLGQDRVAVAQLSRCQDKSEGQVPAQAVRLLDSHEVRHSLNPLDILILFVLGVSLFQLWRRLLRDRT